MALVERSDRLDNIDPADIVDAKITLFTTGYRYGEIDARPFRFDVVSMEGTFSSRAQWHDTLAQKIETGTVLGTFDGTYPDTAIIDVPLDKQAIATFLNNYYKLDTVDDGSGNPVVETITLRTVALRATPAGGMIGSLFGASSRNVADSVRPSLVVQLADTTITLPFTVSNWITDLPDGIEPGDGTILLAAGAPVRTHITFPLDSIPDNAAIHSAELRFHIVPGSESVGSIGSITNIVAYIAGDDPRAPDNFLESFPTGYNGAIYLRGVRETEGAGFSDTIAFRNLGSTIRQWILAERNVGGTGTAIDNNGIFVSLGRDGPNLEGATVDRMQFYGADAPEEGLKPRLRIVYSRRVTE
jgi:hypothetical protein